MKKIQDERIQMFYYLQLQFLNMDILSLWDIFEGIKYSPLYKKNKFTEKFNQMLHSYEPASTKDTECLATHLAIHLSGIEE